jgi:hypothetical protein
LDQFVAATLLPFVDDLNNLGQQWHQLQQSFIDIDDSSVHILETNQLSCYLLAFAIQVLLLPLDAQNSFSQSTHPMLLQLSEDDAKNGATSRVTNESTPLPSGVSCH